MYHHLLRRDRRMDPSFRSLRYRGLADRARVMVRGVVLAALASIALWPTPSEAGVVIDLLMNDYKKPAWILTGNSGRYADTYRYDNTGATLEAGEPTEGGVLTRSIWAQLTPSRNLRVVIHTFGSEIDTVLAVYT